MAGVSCRIKKAQRKPQLIEICKYLGVDHLQYDDDVKVAKGFLQD